uniref:Ribonucleoside-diphosphate reductase subunit alpha n=1 Tax=Lygus hesperus TaxID=30085 RepID=A0A0A9XPS6_LYGHE
MAAAGQFTTQRESRNSWEEESSTDLFESQNGIGITSPTKFIDLFNNGASLLNRFALQFQCQVSRTKNLDLFSPDMIIFNCAKKDEFWMFCSDQIESIYRFVVLNGSPQIGYKYLINSSLLIVIQTATTNMYTLKEVSRLPLTYLRYIKTSQYTWLTMIHLTCENGLNHCDLTTLKPFVFQALTFLHQYFFPNIETERDALAPTLEPVVVFVFRIVKLGIFDSVMLQDHSMDLLKKCLSLNNYETETIFRILITMEILNIMVAKNAMILDVCGMTDCLLCLLEDLMEILKFGERSIYWIATIDSIFILSCQHLKIALSAGVMNKSTLSRVAQIMFDYLDHTFSNKLFFKRPVYSAISVYIDSLLADERINLKMIFNEVDEIENKLTEYNTYFCKIYEDSNQTQMDYDDESIYLSFGEENDVGKPDSSFCQEEKLCRTFSKVGLY